MNRNNDTSATEGPDRSGALTIDQWMTVEETNPDGSVFGAHLCLLIDLLATQAAIRLARGRNIVKKTIETTYIAAVKPRDNVIATWVEAESEENEDSITIKIKVIAKRPVPFPMGGTTPETVHVAEGIVCFVNDTTNNNNNNNVTDQPLVSVESDARMTTRFRIMPHDLDPDGLIRWPVFDHIDTSCDSAYWVHGGRIVTRMMRVTFIAPLQANDFIEVWSAIEKVGRSSITTKQTVIAWRKKPDHGGLKEEQIHVAEATCIFVATNDAGSQSVPVNWLGTDLRYRKPKE